MPDLETLRAELALLDRQILERVGRRQELVSKIGEVKQSQGQSTRDFAQEKEVVERARRTAVEFSLSAPVAEELMRLLIRHALTKQEQQRVIRQAKGSGKRVLVIGGAGQMGRWFVRFLSSQGFEVQVADPAGPVSGFPSIPEWREATLDHDIVVIAAPIRATQQILPDLAERKPPGLAQFRHRLRHRTAIVVI